MKKSGSVISVCRKFSLDLLKISEKTLRIIQKKIKEDESFTEKRGTHRNQKTFEPQVWQLAMDHLKSVPHRPSHYTETKSNRLYFCDADLNIKDLYKGFKAHFL